jgi:hypothetical protein
VAFLSRATGCLGNRLAKILLLLLKTFPLLLSLATLYSILQYYDYCID